MTLFPFIEKFALLRIVMLSILQDPRLVFIKLYVFVDHPRSISFYHNIFSL